MTKKIVQLQRMIKRIIKTQKMIKKEIQRLKMIMKKKTIRPKTIRLLSKAKIMINQMIEIIIQAISQTTQIIVQRIIWHLIKTIEIILMLII